METVQLEKVSVDELKQIIEDIIDKVISKQKSTENQQPTENFQYYTRDEASRLLQISLPTLSKHLRSGQLQAKKLGRRVYISKESIDKALKDAQSVGGK